MISEQAMNIVQFIKFIAVGVWNTVFGYLIFILFLLFLGKNNYMLSMAASNVFAIANAYLSYKHLVFKTKGNYVAESMRFLLLYLGLFMLNAVSLPLMVEILKMDPIVSQAAFMIVSVLVSFTVNKNFTFSK